MLFVDIGGDGDDGVKCVMNTVDLSEPVLDKGGQVLPVSDELIIVTQSHSTRILLE